MLKKSTIKKIRNQSTVWKRFLMLFPTVFLISIFSFFLIYHSPGDMARLVLTERTNHLQLSDEDVQDFAEKHDLNIPPYTMYFQWITKVLRGDFGTSLITNEPVLDLIHEALPKTVVMTLIALAIEIFFGFVFGFLGAWKEGGFFDKIGNYWSVFSMSIPSYWLALIALWLCVNQLKWTFVLGYHGFKSMMVPSFLIGIIGSGGLMRIVKSKVSLVLKESYIEYAISQGLSDRKLIFGHILKNTLPPVISTLTYSLVGLLGGSVLIEKIFSIPGIGLLAFGALANKDIFLLSGIVFYMAVMASILNLLSDLYCMHLDRRSQNELYQG